MSKTNVKSDPKGEECDEEDKTLGGKLFDELSDWTQDFTMHGFPNTMRAEYLSTRIVWGLITLGMLIYSIYCKYISNLFWSKINI
jgi:hypothetical protein